MQDSSGGSEQGDNLHLLKSAGELLPGQSEPSGAQPPSQCALPVILSSAFLGSHPNMVHLPVPVVVTPV